ncbi:MAG: protein kinase [Isosphaeraceae bacterium]|nr:protein kinase [Isosphaeraceae bacterium]
MRIACPCCGKALEFSGDRPSFCAFCGRPLGDAGLDPTGAYGPAAVATTDGAETQPFPNQPPAQDGGDPEPDRVAHYRIVRVLGRGGMGIVYEAEDSRFGRRVALKVITADGVGSRDALERFRQEGRLASNIAHPRCVFVLAADEEAGRPYIVMELMPGATLQTLVEERGPLPVEEAVAKSLDVIEGLQELHAQGIIHRDVKPSNCFLEASGRVKVGDFGLSKSLTDDAHLTRTGAFIGTPLYASPEQIKRDPIDARTDVYSVAATLYYLLAGRPPYRESDATATLARIVSEPPPPLRGVRPEVPSTLDSVILRGLERDPARRWGDLAELREALESFRGRRLSLSGIGLRVFAYLVDATLFQVLEWLVFFSILVLLSFDLRLTAVRLREDGVFLLITLRVAWALYFIVTEGEWAASLGKWLMGLRVAATANGGPPGVPRAGLRFLAFYAITDLPGDLLLALLPPPVRIGPSFLVGFASLALRVAGGLLLITTMRVRSGYRGPHEWVSGTRVVRLPRVGRRLAPRGRRVPNRPERFRAATARPVGVLQSVGPYHVRGAVRWEPNRKVLLGEDSTLERMVWIVLRTKESPPPPAARLDLARPGRLRWLAGGEQPEGRWDAYSAPLGCSLADLAGPAGLPWGDARALLAELAEELELACADGTLPETLSVDQVWVQPDGTIQLVDILDSSPIGPPRATDEERSLALLRDTAVVALEGGRHRGGRPPYAVRSPVPRPVARILDRLLGARGVSPFETVESFRTALDQVADDPTEVSLAQRALHLGLLIPGLGAGVVAMLYVSHPLRAGRSADLAWVAIWPLACVVWSGLTRGGLLMRVAKLSLVSEDNRPAGRLRACGRAALFWAVPLTLLWIACAQRIWLPRAAWLGWASWGAALAVLPLYGLIALISPGRSWHDYLAGTYLVPEGDSRPPAENIG